MNSIVLDIETTGLSPKFHKIIEIYALKLNEQLKEIDHFYSLIKINEPLPKFITELTGITNEDLDKKGQSEKDVIQKFHKFITLSSKKNIRKPIK